MSYLDRLKSQFPEERLPTLLPKLPKAPYDSFDGDQGKRFPEIEAALTAPTATNEGAAGESDDLSEAFEERAAILEYDAGLARADAELEAARITATLARNRGYLWGSLRAALAGSPELLAQLPDRPGAVDALPLGTAEVAVLKDKRVVRQGGFTGSQEVVP